MTLTIKLKVSSVYVTASFIFHHTLINSWVLQAYISQRKRAICWYHIPIIKSKNNAKKNLLLSTIETTKIMVRYQLLNYSNPHSKSHKQRMKGWLQKCKNVYGNMPPLEPKSQDVSQLSYNETGRGEHDTYRLNHHHLEILAFWQVSSQCW